MRGGGMRVPVGWEYLVPFGAVSSRAAAMVFWERCVELES